MINQTFHIIIWKEEKIYVAKFLELELASQGVTQEEAVAHLREALELYLEDATTEERAFPTIENVSTQEIAFN